ncbi:MAG: hypothetical protein WEA61_01850 [Anaerolineales bacterium]
MNRLTKSRKILLAVMVVALLAVALPGAASAADDLVRFKVVNNSDRGITIRLYSQDGSGRAYYMRVEAETTKIMTPPRGMYDYRLTSCGVMVFGEVDLTGPLTWLVPDCGNKGGPGSRAPNTQDVGSILKLTKVKLINKTGTTLKVWLDGPWQYVFNIPSGGSKTVSILKGVYEWGHFACDGNRTEGILEVAGYSTKTFECK